MTSKNRIIALFEAYKEISVKEIIEKLAISKQMAHGVLNRLLEQGQVEKMGRPPKTVYRLIDKKASATASALPGIHKEEETFLLKNFLVITETGSLLEGLSAFDHWCRQRKLPVLKTLQEFISTKKKYERYYNAEGFIDGMEKLKNTKAYEHIWPDELFYVDFYAIERFGKTRLGTLLHFAKQGQNKFLMSIMMKEIAFAIKEFVRIHKADAIGFIPPTIRREVQLMKYLQSSLNIPLPVVDIKKVNGIIPVPQKSLSKIEERITNAEKTFAVTEQRKFKRLVLIDDAVGSGATLNQIAGKIKNKDIAEKIMGLAIVGSFKGFDVITDV